MHHSLAVKDTALISIVIPAYNAAAFIRRTIESVLKQTYRNLEVLVVDDGSRDETAVIVEQLAREDRRIRLLYQANQGVAAARNLGIQAAQGEFIAPIDADDLWHPTALAKLLERLQQAGPSAGLAYAWSRDIDEFDRPTGQFRAATIQRQVLKTLICHNFIGNASATLVRKQCFDRVGGYSTEMKTQQAQGCEDWDLYLRIAAQFEFVCVSEFLVGYRKTSTSMSGDFRKMARSHTLMLTWVRERHPSLPDLLYRLSTSSFYVYFAHQSHQYRQPKTTLFWLGQAWQAAPLLTAIRLGLYPLFLKSLFSVGIQRIYREDSTDPKLGLEGPQPHVSEPASVEQLEQSASSTPPREGLRLGLKLLVGNALHWSLIRS
ncbi:MAG TPA: glycosyltransferase family A protein [Leptolyngbyaceae cyanobacterium]